MHAERIFGHFKAHFPRRECTHSQSVSSRKPGALAVVIVHREDILKFADVAIREYVKNLHS